MSASFEIKSASGSYPVKIEAGLFQGNLERFDGHAIEGVSAVFFADNRFAPILQSLKSPLIAVPAEESFKSLDAITDLVVQLRRAGAHRGTHLYALGGGIIQDIVAFIASIFMRGIPWTYLPTTFLGMADSCIGGKSSINVGPYKNLVGTFVPPAEVLIDPEFTATLSLSQRAEGMIEAAKICYCRGSETFAKYMARSPSVDMAPVDFEALILDSLAAKKWFIETDEFDQKERLLLNFGHTFGHALEGATSFAISHGLGVGLGILCALELGARLERNYDMSGRVGVLQRHMLDLLAVAPELGKTVDSLNVAAVLDRFASDKKHSTSHFSVVLVRSDSDVELFRMPRTPASSELIAAAISAVVQRFKAEG